VINALLLTPLSLPFMQNALLIGLVIATVSALLSCFLILRGWALMGDAVSHAVLPGMVIAAVIGAPVAIGAFVSGLGCALASNDFRDHPRIKPDAALGIVFSGLFALGLVLFSLFDTGQDLMHILFGNILGVSRTDIVQTLMMAVPTIALVVVFRRDLMLVSFDRDQAQALGLPVHRLETGLLVALALSIIAAMQAVGVILVIAMLIAPGTIAYLLTDRFERMLIIAVAAACLATWLGLYGSYHLDVASGPAIVLVQAALFLVALVLAPKKGILAQRRARAQALGQS
jgi:manganese/iron transport system permease protein